MRTYGPVNVASAWWVFDMGNFSNSWRPYSDQSLSCRSRAKWETCGLRLSSMLMVTQANQQIPQGKWSLLQQLVSVRHRISFKTTLSLVRQLRTNIPGTTSSVMLLRLSSFSRGSVQRRLATTISIAFLHPFSISKFQGSYSSPWSGQPKRRIRCRGY